MTSVKLSVNKVCAAVFSLQLLLLGFMIATLYLLTGNLKVIWCGLLFSIPILFCIIGLISILRRKLTAFSDMLCLLLDDMMAGERKPLQTAGEESLFYKINHRLARLYEIMSENRRSIAKERAELQELVSDISHQVKTPIANLKMINTTLLEQAMPEKRQRKFLSACAGQLDKLDFLMQAMIKTSRLEVGVITLEMKLQPVYDTLALALGGILLDAERKHLAVEIDCDENLKVSHDRKWTGEALFNLLDNAVKYTSDGGTIQVAVENLEMYLKIDICDTGKGIPECQQGAVFKRFYREDEVHEIPGIGVGLYLARKIITMQGGYIKVVSEPGCGSVFSVFLPHEQVVLK